MIVLGADPGLRGGIVWLDGPKREVVHAMQLPQLEDGGVDTRTVLDALAAWQPDLMILERVHAFPGQGVTSVFTFGVQFGSLHATLLAGVPGKPICLVDPRRWYRVLGLSAKTKRSTQSWCKQHLPSIFRFMPPRCRVLPDGLSDAAAIAAYGWIAYQKGQHD